MLSFVCYNVQSSSRSFVRPRWVSHCWWRHLRSIVTILEAEYRLLHCVWVPNYLMLFAKVSGDRMSVNPCSVAVLDALPSLLVNQCLSEAIPSDKFSKLPQTDRSSSSSSPMKMSIKMNMNINSINSINSIKGEWSVAVRTTLMEYLCNERS